MKTPIITLIGLTLLTGRLYAQISNPEELARRIVSSTLNIKAGETVVIDGEQEQIPLMEAIAVEVIKKGSYPLLKLQTPKVVQATVRDVPEEYLSVQHLALHRLDYKADVSITISGKTDDNELMKNVPAAYTAKRRQVIDEIHKGDPNLSRSVFLNLGTPSDAARDGFDYDRYQQMKLAATNTDYAAITAKADQLEPLLKSGKKVKVTTANGTNLTFNLILRPVTVNDGVISPEDLKSSVPADRQISLPAGSISVTVDELSANGKVFVSHDQCGEGDKVKLVNASYEFVNGKLKNSKAEAGQECFQETLKSSPPEFAQLGLLQIGLNPAAKIMSDEKHDLRPLEAEGMVYISIGGNERMRGKNKIQEGFSLPLEKATVEIDGKTVVKEGKLTLDSK